MSHIDVTCLEDGADRVLKKLRFFVAHGLQMHVSLFLHNHRARRRHGRRLVFISQNGTAAVDAIIFVVLLWLGPPVLRLHLEVRVVSLHGHLAGCLFV